MTKHPKRTRYGKRKIIERNAVRTERTDFTAFLCPYTRPDTEDYFLHRNASSSRKKNVSAEYGISLKLHVVSQYS